MSDMQAELRGLTESYTRLRRRSEWVMIVEAIATAIIGPIAVAMFLRMAWLDASAGNSGGISLLACAAGACGYLTWEATRFGRKLRAASAAFDETAAEMRAKSEEAYQRGRDDAKAATLELLRLVGQSFANQTGATFEMMFEGEHFICEPREGRHDPIVVSPVRH
jgi:hypothetical protein